MVRAAVSNKDDPDTPCLTFRSLTLGILFCTGLAFVNQLFYFRANPIALGGYVIQLLSFPLGYLMAKILPRTRFRTFGWEWSLNPGPFSIKEHALVSIFAGPSASAAYAIDVPVIIRLYYKIELGFATSVLFILTSQVIAFSLAGFSRKLLVYPAAMIWPANLVSVTVFRTFHEIQDFGGRISRTRAFWLCFASSFVWYLLPGWIFPALSMLPLLCYIAPRSVIANQLGDGFRGLGILAVSLDWSTWSSAYTGSPIACPFPMACNMFAGFVIFMWIITPIGYYANSFKAGNLPIYSMGLFLPNGSSYNISQIMVNKRLDHIQYRQYGPVRITFQFAARYGLTFTSLATLLVYVALYYGKDIVQRVRQARTMDEDIHLKLMRKYKEVPHWWYMVTFVITFVLAIITCHVYHLMPWYWVVVGTILPFIFTIPIGIIQALSNQQPGLNIITEFIIGYARPGDPIANVTFKVYGYITMTQALSLVGDQKLGHYMKIPPRHLFIAQLIGTIICGFVQLGVAFWLIDTVKGMCTPEGAPFTCITTNTFYSASVIWGLVGPAYLFGTGQIYHSMIYLFLVGLLLPIPIWHMSRKYPNSLWTYINVPVIFNSVGSMPPAPTHDFVWFFLGSLLFNCIIHKYWNGWWQRYAFALSAGMDSGLAISGIFIFAALRSVAISWWGNMYAGSVPHCPLSSRGFQP
ncbi:hypothetical protein GGI19_001010 [Coemansia pectinata]|uniref:Oligopeptide transporter n=1 Tax=Coemansia pectinata TaxID=1052879 RepID=A0A9W8H2G9_9FUNG|nr:hypothetical protein GGI19_001010 [Coemansia pectinata]